MRIAFTVLSALLLLAACGSQQEETVTETDSPDTLELAVTDTIGVLMGDSTLMFGSISWAEHHPDGNILILDGMKSQISVFSPDLELEAVHGRHGSGPGEFQYPRYFAVLSNGNIAVSDWGAHTVTILNPDFTYLETVEGFYPIAPAEIVPGAMEGYVGGGMDLLPSDSEAGFDGSTYVGLWLNESEPVVRYESFPLDVTVESNGEETDVNVDNVDGVFDTDPFGNVYVAIRSDSTYTINRYTPEGELDLTIDREWERIEKTEEELQREILIESHSRSDEGGSSTNTRQELDLYPWHNAISVITTDENGYLWVGQGYTSYPVFRVFDPTGELVRIVSIPDLDGVYGLDYSFRHGLLAYDYAPEDYPKVYLLEPIGGEVLP